MKINVYVWRKEVSLEAVLAPLSWKDHTILKETEGRAETRTVRLEVRAKVKA